MLVELVRASIRGDHMLKAHDVAAVIIARMGRPWFDVMSVQKLLYDVQAWHLAIKGERLFEGQFQAWPDGPVLPELMDTLYWEAPLRDEPQLGLSEQISDLIGLVVTTYGSLAPFEVAALARLDAPWREARGNLPEDAPSANVISEDSMARFVRDRRQLHGFTAVDLASGDLYIDGSRNPAPFDPDAFLDSLGPEFDEPAGENPWPTAFGDYKLYVQQDGAEGRGPTDSGA